MPQDLYFQQKFVKQRTDKDLTHKETYCWLMVWDIEGGRLFQSRLPDWRGLHTGGANPEASIFGVFFSCWAEGAGQQQPEQARGKKKSRVDVYLARFLWGIKTELMCPDCTRPWDYRSGQRREKFLPRLVLGVQRAKKAVSGYAAHHQYGGW